MRRAAIAAAVLLTFWARPGSARTPLLAIDPREGAWLGQGENFIHQTRERWSVYPAGANVNKLAVDDLIVWAATDDGVIRFDSGSRRATRITMDDGLPSQVVTAVAFDDQYVWFATNKGVARYRKLDRSIRVYTDADGLPSKAVNDVLTVGRQVWFATRDGIAVYSPDVDGLRAFGEKDGLASGDVAELFQVADDLWCRTEAGLSRFRVQQRVFTNFSKAELKGEQVRVFTVDGQDVWIGTENGLVRFDANSDSIVPFLQQSSLPGKSVLGVETSQEYLFITTDAGIVQYNKLNSSFRRWTVAENLTRQEGSMGSALVGGIYTVMFADGAQMLEVQRDQWVQRDLKATDTTESTTKFRVFGKFNASTPYDFGRHAFDAERYETGEGGIGFGHRFAGDRTLNGSVRLDYGQLEQSGIRDLQYKLEYLGNQNDLVRDVRVEDKLKYRTVEEGLERPLLLQGAEVRAASPGASPKVVASATGGFRRGVVVRDFLTGTRPQGGMYQLSKHNIVPGSERVYVDGELLTSGTDYTVVYTVGQLAFLNPERVDDLSIINVEYESDLVPKKDLGTLSLLDLLPADNEVGGWARAGEARLISDEAGLYNQIDGAAPKYIERSWSRSVYVEYRQGARTIQVAIHDMQTMENAQSLYNFDLPASRLPLDHPKNSDASLDLGLATAYAAKAYLDRFYIELSIDEKSDAGQTSISLFSTQILNRKERAGANQGDQFKELLVASRIGVRPVDGLELGARVVELQQLNDQPLINPATGQPLLDANSRQLTSQARRLTTGMADARYQRQVGEGGLLTGYGEFAGSHEQSSGSDGWAGMGFLRFAHPRLEGMLSARRDSRDFSPLGSDTTRFGKLQDEARLSATGYPTTWLPTTVFFSRQRSWLPDGSDGTGLVQHALGRVQLNYKGLPATTLQLGSTILDDAKFSTNRVQASAQTDYDLAPLLSFTHIKRFTVRGLYNVSQAETDQAGAFAHTDRAQVSRLEAKLSPTATESVYSIFRSRLLERQSTVGGAFERAVFHWELQSGVQSTSIPGVAPKLFYNVISYDDDRMNAPVAASSGASATASPATATGAYINLGPENSSVVPPGPGAFTPLTPTRTAKATVGGEIGIYPGQWWTRLAPLAIVPRLAVSNDESSTGDEKTAYRRTWDMFNRAVWAGGGKLEAELTQRYVYSVTAEDRHPDLKSTEIRNRVVYRPLFTSPITLRLNYQDSQALNTDADAALAGQWAQKTNYFGQLEWLMRWNSVLATRPRTDILVTRSDGLVVRDPTTQSATVNHNTQYQVGGDLEWRFYPLKDISALYLYQRDGVWRLFGDGTGSTSSILFVAAAGVILRLGDNVYFLTDLLYQKSSCSSQPCTPVSRFVPYGYLTINL